MFRGESKYPVYCQAMRCGVRVQGRPFCVEHARMLPPDVLAAAERCYRPGMIAMPIAAELITRLEAVASAIEHVARAERVDPRVANYYRLTADRWRSVLSRPLAPSRA